MNALQQMKRSLFFLFICSIGIIGFADARQISYTYSETLRLGDADEFDENYFFPSTNHVIVGNEGQIFVSDRRQNIIKAYNNEGEFVRQIGKRGRGPGEFLDISAKYIDPSKDHLIVVDRMNLRVVRFDLNGDYVQTHNLPEGPVISPWMGRAGDDGNHYLLYRYPVMPNQPRPDEDYLVHIYDANFSNNVRSFVDVSDFGDTSEYYTDQSLGGPDTGIFKLLPGQRLVGAPHFYGGQVYLYEKKEFGWSKHLELNGEQPRGEVSKEVDASNPPEYAVRMGTPRGAVAYLKFSTTIGLHLFDENTLAHYVHFQDESHENGEIGVSLFDLSDGRFLGYTKIEELSRDHFEPKSTGWDIQIKYSRGNTIYYVDYRYDEPHIVVAEIEFEVY